MNRIKMSHYYSHQGIKFQTVNWPVLMYHGVVDDLQNNSESAHSPFYISTEQFHSQMCYLYDNGYRAMGLAQLVDILSKKHAYDDHVLNKFIVITFDDGYLNNYSQVFPILKKFSFTATFFVVVNRIGTSNYLNWEQLQQMANEGMEIESHTCNHKPLETLSVAEVEYEIRFSKEMLEQKLNRTINFLSYPHGSYNKQIIEIVRKAGYIGACNSTFEFYNHHSNPFEIGRLDIRRECGIEDFIKLVKKDPILIKKIKRNKKIKLLIQQTIGINNYNKLYKKVYKIHRIED